MNQFNSLKCFKTFKAISIIILIIITYSINKTHFNKDWLTLLNSIILFYLIEFVRFIFQ